MAERITALSIWVSKVGLWLEKNPAIFWILLILICILLALALFYLNFRRLKRKGTLPVAEDLEHGEIADYDAGEEKEPFFVKLRRRMANTHDHITGRVEHILSGREEFDNNFIEKLEEVLITADMGIHTAKRLIERINNNIGRPERSTIKEIKRVFKEEILEILSECKEDSPELIGWPQVTMVLGVNGVGKTTTIGKLANLHKCSGQGVLLAAADTFRAAAGEQLEIWGERVGAEVISQKEGADPSAVVFDALHAAVARRIERVIIDTAGRLHTKINLMEELKKIKRVIAREIKGGPHEVLLVLDATTGQNAVSQARMFHQEIGVTGIVLTKLDGTAKGGVIVAIFSELRIPIKYIGIGEDVEDLQPFRAREFVDAIF